MHIFESILFMILGSSLSYLIGNRLGKTEEEKYLYARIGAVLGGILMLSITFFL